MAMTGESISVRLTARQWATIDAGMDNAVSNAIDFLDDRSVEIGGSVRQAGWDQVPWIEGEWPPMEQVITIALSASQWRFVITDLDDSVRRGERRRDQQELDLVRSARDALLPQVPA